MAINDVMAGIIILFAAVGVIAGLYYAITETPGDPLGILFCSVMFGGIGACIAIVPVGILGFLFA